MFVALLWLAHPPGDRWQAVVLRGDRQLTLTLPAW
jgi:hypothetical protein